MSDRMGAAAQRPIVHLSTEPTRRGGERQLSLLHEGLLDRGRASRILARTPDMFAGISDVAPLPWSGVADIIGFVRSWRQIRALDPALLHCHDSRAFTLGALVGAPLRIPVVATRRVLFPIRRHAWNRHRYDRAAALVAISSAVEDALHDIAPTTPTFRVPDGVHGRPVSANERFEARRRLAVDERMVVIGSVAHFTSEKQPELLLDLATHLAQVRDNVVVMLVGRLDPALERSARQRTNVIATGWVEDPFDYYPAFDLYVSTSASEGLGSALLDAVVRDIPAFGIECGGSRDIFGGLPRLATAGDRYDFFRMVERALDGREALLAETRQLGVLARERFSVAGMVEGNLAVYDRVLERTP